MNMSSFVYLSLIISNELIKENIQKVFDHYKINRHRYRTFVWCCHWKQKKRATSFFFLFFFSFPL